jgi:transcriptional regulator with XRE-family HTH domain
MGIKPQMLNKWEKGTRQPNIDLLIAVCDAAGCSLDFIFRGRIGRDTMHPDLKAALIGSYAKSTYLRLDFAPPEPPSEPTSPARRRRK